MYADPFQCKMYYTIDITYLMDEVSARAQWGPGKQIRRHPKIDLTAPICAYIPESPIYMVLTCDLYLDTFDWSLHLI